MFPSGSVSNNGIVYLPSIPTKIRFEELESATPNNRSSVIIITSCVLLLLPRRSQPLPLLLKRTGEIILASLPKLYTSMGTKETFWALIFFCVPFLWGREWLGRRRRRRKKIDPLGVRFAPLPISRFYMPIFHFFGYTKRGKGKWKEAWAWPYVRPHLLGSLSCYPAAAHSRTHAIKI